MEKYISKPSVSVYYIHLRTPEVVYKKNDGRSIALAKPKGTNTFGKY